MNMDAARLWFEAHERSLPYDSLRVWDRRSPFHPTSRAEAIEAIFWIGLGLDYAADMQINISPIVELMLAERCLVP